MTARPARQVAPAAKGKAATEAVLLTKTVDFID
jgi:hypothetical protein